MVRDWVMLDIILMLISIPSIYYLQRYAYTNEEICVLSIIKIMTKGKYNDLECLSDNDREAEINQAKANK